jgi:hypothetical protein
MAVKRTLAHIYAKSWVSATIVQVTAGEHD